MGYEIAVSYNFNDSIKEKIIKKSEKYLSVGHYEQYELRGRRNALHSQRCILTILFEDNAWEIQKFIRFIKKLYGVKLESICKDNEVLD